MEYELKIERITSIETLGPCACVLTDAYNAAPWNESWTRETALELLTCYYHTPKFMGWAARSGSQIIGAAVGNIEPHYSGGIFYLKELFVCAQYQRTGIGKRLIAAIKKESQRVDVRTMMLFTTNDIAGFYIGCGFTKMEDRATMIYSDMPPVA